MPRLRLDTLRAQIRAYVGQAPREDQSPGAFPPPAGADAAMAASPGSGSPAVRPPRAPAPSWKTGEVSP